MNTHSSSMTVPTVDEFKKALHRHGLKATRQRVEVHEAMMSLIHASADTVTAKILSKGSTVTVASVYNILTQLADLKIYGRRLSSNNKMYFDVNNFKHIHLYDTVNNDFKDVVDDELLEMVESRIRSKRYRGYKVDGVDIQIICHPTVKKSTVTR